MSDDNKPGQREPEGSEPEDIPGMSEEELRQKIEEQIRKQSVADVLVQFMASLSNLAYMKMGLTEDTKDIKDIEQARLAVDGFKALLDAAAGRLAEQDKNALAGALASMQLTFVKQFPAGENKPEEEPARDGKAPSGEKKQKKKEPSQADRTPAKEEEKQH